MKISSSAPRRIYAEQDSGVVVVLAASNSELIEFDTTQLARLAMQIKNLDANAFDTFIVQGKVHPDGDFVQLLGAAGDFTSPAGIVVDASGDLTALAASTSGWLLLDVLAFSKIRVLASKATGDGTARVLAGGA